MVVIDQLRKLVFRKINGNGSNRDIVLNNNLIELKRLSVELEEVETMLEESERRYRELFERSADGIASCDLEGNLVSANGAYLDMIGYTWEEIKGVSFRNITPEKWRSFDMLAIRQALGQGYSDLYEKEHIKKNGEIISISIRIWTTEKPTGEIDGFWGVVRDITEQKNNIKQLVYRDQIAKVCLTIFDEEIFEKVLSIVLEATDSEYGSFGYLDKEGNLICPSLTRSVWSKCDVPQKNVVFPAESLKGLPNWNRAIKKGECFYVNTPVRVPEGHVPIECLLISGVVYDKECVGCIGVANKKGGYDEEDKELLEGIMGCTAPAIYLGVRSGKWAMYT